ncbi:cardiolipin synthetase 2 [Palleronia aestuarii]|uniref:Phospholipase D n=1 Tax=Palleronia aestuarii TaxID=568105 RepID=A0A2W7N2Q6_9RHOB|nr:phospholipase D-like domain-containing protein [Palleronia aestuarii]PZX14321.1 cardiolipin synthetase 2 [Palleronia aestuarii]
MIGILPHIGVVAGVVLTLLAVIFMLQQRRTPQSAVAWLLFFVALPYLAIPVFVALGIRKRGRGFPPVAFSRDGAASDAASGPAATFAALGVPPAEGGHRIEILEDGQEAYARMMALIEGAREEIDAAFYLVADDAVGRAFVEALTGRAREGVRVRLLIDRLGGWRHPRRALAAFREAGGELRWFSPLVAMPLRGHLNLRNHRKLVVADGLRAFAGGMNVGGEYMGPDDAPRWSDLAYLVEGPATAVHHDLFESDWAGRAPGLPQGRDPDPTGGEAVAQLVPSGPDMRGDALHDGIVQAIHTARRRVWIATPYFLPTEYQAQALATAALRGIDVLILVPRISNHRIADFARGAYLRDLGSAGARVLLYEDGMLHAKAGLVDDAAWLGSANFDVRSMLLNFEMALFLYDGQSVGRLETWFAGQERRSSTAPVTAGPGRRIVEGVFRLGAPVL